MKLLFLSATKTCLLLALSSVGFASDQLEDILQGRDSERQTATTTDGQVIENWKQSMVANGVSSPGNTPQGVRIVDGSKYIVSVMEAVQVSLGQPGWVESRVKAYERALLRAQTELSKEIAQSIESENSLGLLEASAFGDGNVEEVKELSRGRKLIAKGADFAETFIDSKLLEYDPNYDPSKYDVEEKLVTYEQWAKSKIGVRASAEIQGATVSHLGEGKVNGTYNIVLSLFWSPKLSLLAKSMSNGTYNMPSMGKGKPLTEYIPQSVEALVSTQGPRVVVDENGNFALISFGQAQPRNSSKARQAYALNNAKQVAELRAKSYLTRFIRANVSSEENLLGEQLAREFGDLSYGVENTRDFNELLVAKSAKLKISGVRKIEAWSYPHPETGQWVAGSIVVWSPKSLNESRALKEALTQSNSSENGWAVNPSAESLAPTDNALQSIEVDISNY